MTKKRIASIDFGLKRLGLAISDENQVIATSLGVVLAGRNNLETIQKLLALLRPYELEKMIIGNPIHLDGRISFLADEVKHFQSQLQSTVPYQVELFDERLSSAQAERTLKEGGMRRKKRAKIIDAVSAVIILQSYLGY